MPRISATWTASGTDHGSCPDKRVEIVDGDTPSRSANSFCCISCSTSLQRSFLNALAIVFPPSDIQCCMVHRRIVFSIGILPFHKEVSTHRLHSTVPFARSARMRHRLSDVQLIPRLIL